MRLIRYNRLIIKIKIIERDELGKRVNMAEMRTHSTLPCGKAPFAPACRSEIETVGYAYRRF